MTSALTAPALEEDSLRRHARRWTGILSAYFGAQGLAQGSALVAGLVFVNILPVDAFALYALANSLLALLAFLTDLGATSSLLHFFHRSSGDVRGADFPAYVSAVRGLRRLAFCLAAPVVAGALLWSARVEGFPASAGVLATLAVVVAGWLQVDATLRVLVLRLHDRQRAAYRAEILGAGARLGLALAIAVAGWREAWPALAAAALAAAVTAREAAAGPPGPPAAAGNAARRREVLRFLLPTLPAALYYSIQGPLVVWLAASFGGTQQIAEVGALGRLGMITSLLSGLVGVVFLPRLARVADDALFLRRYLQFGALLALLGVLLVLAAALAPRVFLALLGRHYAALEGELVLVLVAAGLTLLGGYAVGVNATRSWTRWQGAAALAMLVAQALLAAALPLWSTAGVLQFGAASAAVGLALQLLIATAGFLRPGWVVWRTA